MVECTDVTKIYNTKYLNQVALHDVSLSIAKGTFCIVKGPSGSGKTTLLNLLGLLDVPSAGKIFLDAIETSTLNDRQLSALRARKIGFIFQNYNLISVLSAYENVCYPLRLTRSERVSESAIRELFEKLEIWGLHKKRPDELSGGQQQRVAIARALIMEPEIVLADEPTANLDSQTGRTITEMMFHISKEIHTTFVIATHDQRIASYAETLVEMKDGTIEKVTQ